MHLTFSENISSASAYEHDNNIEISTTIDGPVVTLDTTSIENTDTLVNATVYDYAGNSYSLLPINISSLISAIEFSSLSITNNGTSFVRADQNISVTLVTEGTDLGNFTGIILGKNITDTNPSTVTINNATPGTAIFTTTVLPTDTNGNITFSITMTNSSGSQLLVTDKNITDGSFVTIDTVKPVIELVGASFVSVLQGNPYSDLGTIITDQNNPSYTGTASATSVDTSSLALIIINYTGPADAAGNVPDPISRSVLVVAKPLGIVTLTIESNNANNNLYAKIGDEITITFVANGTIGSATGTIASNTVVSTPTGNTLVEKYIIDSSVSDTNSLAFSISVHNEDLKTLLRFTDANLTGSSLVVDNTAPTIVLVGNNNTVVPTNSSYTDRTWITCLIIWCSISKRIDARFINIKIICYSIYLDITCI